MQIANIEDVPPPPPGAEPARATYPMLYCPDDLEPCRRAGCGAGRCLRLGAEPMTHCWECGVVVMRHAVVAVCVECHARYAPHVEEQET